MFVSDHMSKQVESIELGKSVGEALGIMRAHEFEALPVKDNNGDLAGIITEHDILVRLSENPSSEFLGKVLVDDVMVDNVLSIQDDEIIESAAYYMRKNDYSALPVVNARGKLIGIITQADIYATMVDMMGLTERGTRITLILPDRVGVLADAAAIVKKCGVSIASVATMGFKGGQLAYTVFRIRTIDADPVVQGMVDAGIRVVHVSQVWE